MFRAMVLQDNGSSPAFPANLGKKVQPKKNKMNPK